MSFNLPMSFWKYAQNWTTTEKVILPALGDLAVGNLGWDIPWMVVVSSHNIPGQLTQRGCLENWLKSLLEGKKQSFNVCEVSICTCKRDISAKDHWVHSLPSKRPATAFCSSTSHYGILNAGLWPSVIYVEGSDQATIHNQQLHSLKRHSIHFL